MKQFFIFWTKILTASTMIAMPIVFVTAAGIENPIGAKNLQCLVLYIFQQIVYVAGFVCVGYFIWAGFLFVQAQGSSEGIKRAKNVLTNVIIGTILVMGAWVFADVISRTINNVAGRANTSSLAATQC